jgi:hypothetical protein
MTLYYGLTAAQVKAELLKFVLCLPRELKTRIPTPLPQLVLRKKPDLAPGTVVMELTSWTSSGDSFNSSLGVETVSRS